MCQKHRMDQRSEQRSAVIKQKASCCYYHIPSDLNEKSSSWEFYQWIFVQHKVKPQQQIFVDDKCCLMIRWMFVSERKKSVLWTNRNTLNTIKQETYFCLQSFRTKQSLNPDFRRKNFWHKHQNQTGLRVSVCRRKNWT